jgi:hypothetical protein
MQPLPAAKFLLKQSQSHFILASGHQAGEMCTNCAITREKGVWEIDMKLDRILIMDIDGSLYTVTSRLS